jgi:phospholipase/carboxylesterase
MSRGSPHASDDPHDGEPLVTDGTPVEDADAAVVLVHGRGATARSVLQLGAQVAGDRDVALLAPQAAANTWYPNSFLSPLADNEPGRSSGLRAVGRAVATATDAGIDTDRVLIGGFSQGACLAAEFVARTPARYGGLVVLSGGLIGDSITVDDYVETAADAGFDDPTDALVGTPAFLGCSDVDPHIPEERVHETAEVLEALGADVDVRIYEGMGHGINDDEIEAISEILVNV